MEDLEVIPYDNQIWEEGSIQWLERYEYIEKRSETYLDYFRDSLEYDFTRLTSNVKTAQDNLGRAYAEFASGEISVDDVKKYVLAFKESIRKSVDLLKANPTIVKTFKGYTPYFQAIKAFNQALDIHLFFCGKRRPPGIDSVCIETGEGFLADGTPTDGDKLLFKLRDELYNKYMITQKHHVEYYQIQEKEYTLAPLNPEYVPHFIDKSIYEPLPKKRSIDELKAEYEADRLRKLSMTSRERKEDKKK